MTDLLLVCPPMTQLNTPYPATAYLCRYLRGQGYQVEQADLGIELIDRLFSKDFLDEVFGDLEEYKEEFSEASQKILRLAPRYLNCVEAVIAFLRGENDSLAHRIVGRRYLPEGERFHVIEQLPENIFGQMSLQDKAKLMATLFVEDLAFFIQETLSEHFEFTRYAEKISQFLPDLTPMIEYLDEDLDTVSEEILMLLESKILKYQPKMIGFSVPFPGNLYAAFIMADFLKKRHPEIKILLGGGFPNTELRELTDKRIFDYFDYITLDDGEIPLERLLQKERGEEADYCRTYCLEENELKYYPEQAGDELEHDQCSWPDYRGLDMSLYLNTFDVANPMNRLWSDGRWNKLTIAHGCYWKKCTFCDVHLDYISRYSEAPAEVLCDRMEQIIAETGQTGFHFVDEACPPDLLLQLSLEILRRGLQVTWWGNIRFEKAFTVDLVRVMAEAGCIAVSGGLEVAEERLLKLIKKGTGIKQTVQALTAFREAGVMVHAYLMYGFPTQTDEETIEALETVRQLFANGLVQSAFWHRFALTAHSPVYRNPELYDIEILDDGHKGFARNEVPFKEKTNKTDHASYADGLRQAVYNYMHGQMIHEDVRDWFEFDVPATKASAEMVECYVDYTLSLDQKIHDEAQVLYLGFAEVEYDDGFAYIAENEARIRLPEPIGEWLENLLPQLTVEEQVSFVDMKDYFLEYFNEGILEQFLASEAWEYLRRNELLILPKPRRHKAQELANSY